MLFLNPRALRRKAPYHKPLKKLASEAVKRSDEKGADGLCLDKKISFLGTKIIFKSVINYVYNLVQVQQIHLAEEKQWSERLRNVIIIISETPAFFQASLTNRCWPSYTVPDCPAVSRAMVCARMHILLFLLLLMIYLAWQHLNYQASGRTRGWTHIIPLLHL